ncbi:hypothetical protein ACU8V7_10100 [Zobellia nedashkovskayae]
MQNKTVYTALKAFKFLIIFVIADFLFGTVAKQLYFGQETGKQARITYSLKQVDTDILILGSSHANKHFVPNVFEQNLNKTCYNAGVQGQGVLFQDALVKMILQERKPELIILNIDDIWLYENNSNYDRLSDLHPYYWDYRDVLKPILGLKSKIPDFKLIFKSYQYNSTLVHAIKYLVSPQKDFEGYIPLKGVIKPQIQKGLEKRNESTETPKLDPNFISAYKSFIATCKINNVNLLFVVSPWYEQNDLSNNNSMLLLQEIAKTENIPVLNLYNDKRFLNQDKLFNDTSHLNDTGAHLFSEIVAKYAKSIQ